MDPLNSNISNNGTPATGQTSAAATPTNNLPNPLLTKSINSQTLSKALTRPPPLSSVLGTLPKPLTTLSNGTSTPPASLLSPSPSILQQQLSGVSQPLIGSNLIAQSKRANELQQPTLTSNQNQSNSSLNLNNGPLNSINNNLPNQSQSLSASLSSNSSSQFNNNLFSNSLPANPTTSQLFSNVRPPAGLGQPASAPVIASQTLLSNQNPTPFDSISHRNTPVGINSEQPVSTPITNTWYQTQPQMPPQPLATPIQQNFSSTQQSSFNNNQSQPQPPQIQPPPSQPPSVSGFNPVSQNNYFNGPPTTQQSKPSTPLPPQTTTSYQQPYTNSVRPPMTQTFPPQSTPPVYQPSVVQPPPTTGYSGPPTSSYPPVQPTQPMPSYPGVQPGPPTSLIGPPPTGPSSFAPSASTSQPAPPPTQPMSSNQYPFNNNNNNTNKPISNSTIPPYNTGAQNTMNSSIRPPPTAADLNRQTPSSFIQQQPQSGFQPQPYPTASNSNRQNNNYPNLNNQFNNMNISAPPTGNTVPPITNSSSSSIAQNSRSGSAMAYNQNNRNQPQSVDLLREKRLIMPYSNESEEPIRPVFPHDFYTNVNCHADTIRCTLTSIPESQSILSKCRLPLGILIHPFKDLESLKVVQSSTIVRCRNCRSYINPFVHFLDNSKWRCNMCYSINDLPDEFLFDPVTRSYGDPSKRPEINSSTIEFIAPPEYTLRPPPPAMYLYLLDVSHNAINTGYLHSFCETLLENLDKIPGDSRTQIGFITYNSSIHFYNLSDSLSQPRMMIYPDLDDLVLPMPDSLTVNLHENKESIQLFLQSLPNLFADTYETDSALGTALTAGFQLLKNSGGRITIMQTCLPNIGVGSLKVREESIDKDSANLAPQSDFYKKMALECAGVHVAVDLFMFNSLYADLATLSCISKYSGGEVKYYPGYHVEHYPEQVIRFCVDFKRYVTRKIGFEAVMRIRCTRGLAIHTFHGNFFVRSTDLLALPNVNPDSGFGMQVTIEETLTDIPTVCFQAAVLYTSSKSERRIRIHTYCLPVTKSINELVNGADQEAIVGLVSKMAVDRTVMNSLKDAKDAMINVAIDYLQAYANQLVSSQKNNSLMSPYSLRLIPAFILSLMKNIAFRFGSIKMDDRVYAMNVMKTMPLKYLMLCIYPHLYAVHNLDDNKIIVDSSETEICIPPRLHLSSENIDRHGVYIMDCGEAIYMWIGRSVSDQFLQQVFDCRSFQELPDHSHDLPELDNILSERIRNFLVYLYDSRPFGPTFIYFREDSPKSLLFFQHMHEDKTESSISYYEFLRHLTEQVNS